MPNRYNLLSDVYEFAIPGHADAVAASFCRYQVRTAQRRSVPTLFTGGEAQYEGSRALSQRDERQPAGDEDHAKEQRAVSAEALPHDRRP